MATSPGNPETLTDPSGQMYCDCLGGGGSDGSGSGGTISCNGYVNNAGQCVDFGTTNTGGGNGSGGNGGGANGGGNCALGTPSASSHACAIRQAALDNLTNDYWIKTVVGSVIIALADILDFVANNDILSRIEDAADILSSLLQGIIPGIGWLLQHHADLFGSWAGLLNNAFQTAESLEGGIQDVLGIVRGAIGLYKGLNFFTKWAFLAAVKTVDGGVMLVGGPLSILGKVVVSVFSGLVSLGGHFLLGQASFDQAEIARESQMDIGQWCIEFGKGKC